jgi:FkbM family methyltransferase
VSEIQVMIRRIGNTYRYYLRRLIKSAYEGRIAHTPMSGLVRRLAYSIGWPLLLDRRAMCILDNPREFIQREIFKKGTYEPEIATLIQRLIRPGDIFFDVGANIGCHTLVAASCGIHVRAFEPVPRLAERLRANIKLSRLSRRVVVHEVALSRENGSSALYIADRRDDGSHSLLPGVKSTSTQIIQVETRKLDTVVSETACGYPNLIKIDVEGAEALVLDGAEQTLSIDHPPIIIIETGDRLADSIGESAFSVLNRLSSRGYHLFNVSLKNGDALVEVGAQSVSGEVCNYIAIPANSDRMQVVMQPVSW